jgi:molybdate transport system ATP-binding protein
MTKEEILPYFEALHATLSIPVLYVSHDISEVERLADTMVLLEVGRVVAAGPLGELLTDSRLPIARPAGVDSPDARVGAFDANDGLTALDVGGQPLLVPKPRRRSRHAHRVRIAATDVSLTVDRPSQTTILNILPVRVLHIGEPLNEAQINVVVTLGHRDGGPKLLARVTRRAQRLLGFGLGQDVYAQIKAVSLVASSGRPAASARSADIVQLSDTAAHHPGGGGHRARPVG